MSDDHHPDPERRGFLRDLARPFQAARGLRASKKRPPLSRPPWALPEEDFLATCEKCHLCVEACPPDAIIPAIAAMPGGEGYPVVLPNRVACDLCGECARVCPTGAIRKGMTPREAKLGTAKVLTDRCVLGKGEACSQCLDACPFPGEAIAIETGFFPHVKKDVCVGCGLCVMPCPGQAIHVAPS